MKTFSTFLFCFSLLTNVQASDHRVEAEEEFAQRLGITVEELHEMQKEELAVTYIDDGWSDGEGGIEGAEARQVTQEDIYKDLAFNPLLQVLPFPFQVIQLLPPEFTEESTLDVVRDINLQMIKGLAEHLNASETQTIAAIEKLELFLQEHKRIFTPFQQ